jgi:hypothetical protein
MERCALAVSSRTRLNTVYVSGVGVEPHRMGIPTRYVTYSHIPGKHKMDRSSSRPHYHLILLRRDSITSKQTNTVADSPLREKLQ